MTRVHRHSPRTSCAGQPVNLDGQSAEQVIDWRWVAQARLAALRMQSMSDEARMQAVLVARTTMTALTADHTPIGRSPLIAARALAEELAEAYPSFEASAFHCASLLFFFDLIDAKYYHDIGLPPEFWFRGSRLRWNRTTPSAPSRHHPGRGDRS